MLTARTGLSVLFFFSCSQFIISCLWWALEFVVKMWNLWVWHNLWACFPGLWSFGYKEENGHLPRMFFPLSNVRNLGLNMHACEVVHLLPRFPVQITGNWNFQVKPSLVAVQHSAIFWWEWGWKTYIAVCWNKQNHMIQNFFSAQCVHMVLDKLIIRCIWLVF